MRLIVVVLLACVLAGVAQAAQPSWSNRLDARALLQQKLPRGGGIPLSFDGVLSGGEDIPNATVISSLPYQDTGNTCGHLDDYDAVCPFTDASPDVVYRYTPAASGSVDVSLCGSQYDTKLFVLDGSEANVIACNDDACGLQSSLTDVALEAGHDYYIVVDGFAGGCGDYTLAVSDHQGCTQTVACEGYDQVENEPACFDGFVDTYDGGCNSTPPVFLPVTCGTICGTAGTYTVGGEEFRDTDWYELTVGAGTFTFTGVANGFDLQILVLSGTCASFEILQAVSTPSCIPATLTFEGPGTFMLWAGPLIFSGVPCGSEYRLDIVGPGITPCESATVAHRPTWGSLKALYR